MTRDFLSEGEIRAAIEPPRTIVIVGMSPNPDRPSRRVGLYLLSQGFTVWPIHPTAREIGGLFVYPVVMPFSRETEST